MAAVSKRICFEIMKVIFKDLRYDRIFSSFVYQCRGWQMLNDAEISSVEHWCAAKLACSALHFSSGYCILKRSFYNV